MNRELDGIYFRIWRNGKWQNVCFSDLTEAEMDEVLKDKNIEYVKNLAKILGFTIAYIGEKFGLISEKAEENNDEN